jgi:predicted transcriptional regulator
MRLSDPEGGARHPARDLLCYWATEHLNVRQRELAGLLNITQSAVSMAAGRGRIQAEELKLSFEI